jgi:hypothetical protein
MKRPEQQLQAAVVKWWAFAHNSFGVRDERVLMHIPNGGGRSVVEAKILKGQGVRPGVPDLFLAVPRPPTPFSSSVFSGASSGMWIELKAGAKSPVTELQHAMHATLRAHGYVVLVCRTFDEAIKAIADYLKF